MAKLLDGSRIYGNAVIDSTLTAANLAANSGATSTSIATGALVVTGGAGISGNLYITGAGDVSANIGALLANAGSQATSINTINANVGAFHQPTSANIGVLFLGNASTQANIGTITTSLQTLNANVGAYEIYANANLGTATTNITTLFSNAATQQTQINSLVTNANANVAAYLLNNVIKFNSNLVLTSADDTVSPTTGALVIPTGGLSVGGNAYVGHNLYVGTGAFSLALTAPTIFAVDAGSAYTQMAIQNTASTGSADFAAYGDNSTETNGWADMGFAGSTFNDSNYTITGPGDGYFIVEGTNNTIGGNLILATGSTGFYKEIIFGVGGFDQASIVGRFHGNATNAGYMSIETNTGAINTLSGALRVTGGAGFTENVYADKLYTVAGLYWAGNGASFVPTSTYSNTNVAAYLTSQSISSANIGGSQTYANTQVQTINANLGSFQTYANANLSTQTTNTLNSTIVNNSSTIQTVQYSITPTSTSGCNSPAPRNP